MEIVAQLPTPDEDRVAEVASQQHAPAEALSRWLISQVASGNCILFIGAGLSREANDPQGRSGPTGNELATEISERFLGKYEGWPLALAASYAISVTSRLDVDSFVRERLEGLEPTPGTLALTKIPWRAIYTTNFDRLIEKSYDQAEVPLYRAHPIYSSRERLRDLKSNEIPYYKLHGSISRIDVEEGGLVLTGQDLARSRSSRKRLFDRLAADMSEYTIVYAGYGRQDPISRNLSAR